MRTRTWILLTGLQVLPSTGLTAQDYAAQTRQYLTDAQERLLPDYGPPLLVIEGKIEEYSSGFSGGHDFILNRDLGYHVNYLLLGACDADCRSLGLYWDNDLGESGGNDSEDALPLTTIDRGTEIDLEVRVNRCDNEPCYYAIGVYAITPRSGRMQVNCPPISVAPEASWMQTRLWDAQFSESVADGVRETAMGREAFCFDVQPDRTYEIGAELETLEGLTLTLYDGDGVEWGQRYVSDGEPDYGEPINYTHDSESSTLMYVVVTQYQTLDITGTYTLRVAGTR